MKRAAIIFIAALLPVFAELSVEKIDQMVQQIQGKRSSKVEIDFNQVSSPFVRVVPSEDNRTVELEKLPDLSVQFHLGAIINQRAKINDRWVEVGDTIQGYTVETVEEGHVVLKKADREVELFLPEPKKNQLIQISEG